jgi:hypothetical protein
MSLWLYVVTKEATLAELPLQVLHDRIVKRRQDLAMAEDRGLNHTALNRMYTSYMDAFHIYMHALDASKEVVHAGHAA